MTQSTMMYEEDIEAAFAKSIEILGPVGKYDLEGNLKILVTKEHGKLWYGDLNKEDIEYRIPALAKVIGVEEILLI